METLTAFRKMEKNSKNRKKYRSRMDIVSEMLETARSGATKTQIIYKVYLSGVQVVEYMNYLQQKDMLRYDIRTNKYTVTDNGLKILNKLHEINDLLPMDKHAYV